MKDFHKPNLILYIVQFDIQNKILQKRRFEIVFNFRVIYN